MLNPGLCWSAGRNPVRANIVTLFRWFFYGPSTLLLQLQSTTVSLDGGRRSNIEATGDSGSTSIAGTRV